MSRRETIRVSVRQLRDRLSDYLTQAEFGKEIEVTVRSRLVARIIPPHPLGPRPLGLLKGKLDIAPDFDATSPKLIAAMEGRRHKR
jgi:prevent-host-death family protein